MKKNIVEALIGAVVLIVAGGFFMLTYKSTEFGTVEGYELIAKFERVDGLHVGSDVRLGGIRVGSVIDQEVDPETYQAVIRISVAPHIRLPEDSSASITSESLLGNSYLSLEPGGMEDYLQDGDQIEFTQGSIDIMDLISRAVFSPSGEGGDNQ